MTTSVIQQKERASQRSPQIKGEIPFTDMGDKPVDPTTLSRSSSRQGRIIRVPFYSVVYFSRGTPNKLVRKGTSLGT